jgi:hypothetical protein
MAASAIVNTAVGLIQVSMLIRMLECSRGGWRRSHSPSGHGKVRRVLLCQAGLQYESVGCQPVSELISKKETGMRFNKSKWLAYTLLIGLVPVLTRLMIWFVTSKGTIPAVVATDFVAFGLVLHVSIMNEIEFLPASEGGWKTLQNGTSIFFITLYSALYAMCLLSEGVASVIDARALLQCSLAFAVVSAMLSFFMYHRLSRMD